MRMVFIDKVSPGMTVAKDVFLSGEGTPLVKKSTKLTPVMISQMDHLGIRFVYIDDKPGNPVDASKKKNSLENLRLHVPKPEPLLPPALREEAIGSLQDIFSSVTATKEKLHESAAKLIGHIDSVVGQLVDSLLEKQSAFVNINDLKSYDEYTFHHSLSVAVLSIAIGQKMGLGRKELNRLGVCAMMHDIGKTAIPIEIIHKASRLNDQEFAIVKNHSPAGYNYLIDAHYEDEDIQRGVLHHHEKLDGTGYPHGIEGAEIPLWSRIISVADVYDALTSHRPYRTPMQPAEALEYVMGGIGSSFEYDIVDSFVKKLELYPPGTFVELSDGSIAVVLNSENPMRPVVRLANGDICDLFRDRRMVNVTITNVLDESELEKRIRP